MTRIRARIMDSVTGDISSREFTINKKWDNIAPNDVRQLLGTGERLYGYALLKRERIQNDEN